MVKTVDQNDHISPLSKPMPKLVCNTAFCKFIKVINIYRPDPGSFNQSLVSYFILLSTIVWYHIQLKIYQHLLLLNKQFFPVSTEVSNNPSIIIIKKSGFYQRLMNATFNSFK